MTLAPQSDRLDEIRSLARESTPNPDPATGLTVMEAVAYVAGLPLSNAPACTDPRLAAFLTSWSADLDGVERDALLLPLVSDLVGARRGPPGHFGNLALAWLLRDALPAWLRVSGHRETEKFETDLPAPTNAASLKRWTDEVDALSRFTAHVLGEDFGDELGGAEIARYVLPRLPSTGETAAAAAVEDLFGPEAPLAELAADVANLCHVSACLGSARAAKAAVAEADKGSEELAATAAVMTKYDGARVERQRSALRLVGRMCPPRISDGSDASG